MNNLVDFNAIISRILLPLKKDKISLNGEVFRFLFLLSFDSLKAAEVGNPLIHHLVVLKHVIEIAQEENLNILHAGAIAILHDIAPIEKIRKADLLGHDDLEVKRLLDEERKQHRVFHMREGSELAREKLLLLNEYLGQTLFSDQDIKVVCNVISIHDNPSIDYPIPKENHLAVSFREADRLWMLSNEGFRCDLERDAGITAKSTQTETLAINRLNHILKRFKEERKLYNSNDGPFLDDDLFFRTKSGYHIYLKYLSERKEQHRIRLYESALEVT
ncbi:MAG: hypothetical protein ACE5IR_09465 [bacterium]